MARPRFILGLTLLLLAATPLCAVSVQPGWPQVTGFRIGSSPALGDLDGDGELEVVIGSDDFAVHAWHRDGTPVMGWPQTTGNEVISSPGLSDLDGDGQLEVVVGSRDAKVYAWHHDGTAVTGWPQTTGASDWGIRSSPALADLDGDGAIEVVVGSMDGKVYAWRADGSLLPGWPQTTGDGVESSPALGDLDGDGGLEVVVGSRDGKVYAWHGDGTPLSGWPQTSGGAVGSSPALADLDGDGTLEAAVGSHDAKVYAWHASGSPVAGWPQATGSDVYASPAAGDIDGDGYAEVVVGSWDSKVYAWHHDGTPVAGWPQATGNAVYCSPALGDLDGDGYLEVVVGSYDGNVYAWHHDGLPVTGWPQTAGAWVESCPALGDLDGDGDVEVVVGSWDAKVYAWSCDTPATDPLPWPMFHHDLTHTGFYGITAQFSAQPLSGPAPLAVAFTDRSTGNPTSWAWDFGDGATSTDRNPSHTYQAAGHRDVALRAATTAVSGTRRRPRYILAYFADVPPDHWAFAEVLACADAHIVVGYPDALYHPAVEVTRDQMAVYIARAVATPTGDEGVPEPAEGTQSFIDVEAGSWAYRYIEYCAAHGIVEGYWNGAYRPDLVVDRGQMSVYIARAVAGGEAAVPDPDPGAEPTFADVTLSGDWSWCYKYVEYCAAHDIVQGYWDGYHPEREVTRDQMAVYVQRAFGLPL